MYKIVDLFAGAGGLSLGFEMTEKFEIVAFVENNKNAAKTYLKNHSNIKNYEDILKLDFNDILSSNPNIDVVIGGPPCQGFSNANRQRRKLINGSNELVKKYVEAIRVIKPSVFVMENVKTIASDKHSFCLTRQDENHINNDLKLNLHNKDVVLYEDEAHIDELVNMVRNNNYRSFVLLNEDQLYLLKNITKKKEKLKEYFSKNSNTKLIEQLISCMQCNGQVLKWYHIIVNEARESLLEVYKTKSMSNKNYNKIMKFWDIQRLFIGVNELNIQNTIYEVVSNNNQIIIRMQTYIVIDYIKASFKYLGYKIKGRVLNAVSFGTPQCRERYILVGAKEEILGDRKIELPNPIIDNEMNYITVKDAISDLEKYEPSVGNMDEKIHKNYKPKTKNFYGELISANHDNYIYNHVCTDTREVAKSRFAVIKQGDNFHSLPDAMKETYENPGRTQNTIYKRLEYMKPSDTVVNVRKSMWIHPKFNRAVSAREAARLQSFPDNYVFYGTKDSVYQQIGNAVPPILGRAVAETVLNLLNYNGKYVALKSLYDKYNK
ncbi:DNA cytosine methyltransferase [Clostridium botulinum]|uniref:Cytosine-specific methyltransferase n=1 Tax=Clostridium botulinum (strain Langeland / NCTC 10281 / Type F) TaxID=441772 RepID=A7GF25_CLOBL|nr:DNA cytosine methyltransferase [Clostridium botulinum]ABS41291.1 DNA (cytosine-5-)-methyltransferase [Clostridium botulinum F str. Langeland]ADF99789.1 DNA (cytosine-5-)-methyltransferase [Clostridium botulinum F str. 230613]KKM42633.1 DNA methyltransferase [Clostridium botulinum]MBY6794088.1 DNA cytosine methyltransferase [Clostridium botulinum]MBY6937087.1 DNA cytosine methyltransferase [Clostridium botulinum]